MSESSQHAPATKQELQQHQRQLILAKHGAGVLEVDVFLPEEQHHARLGLHGMTTNAVVAQEDYDDW